MSQDPLFHPLANLFPPMRKTEFEELCADIKERGQLHSILTFNGLIVDGRHRWQACALLGIPPITKEWDGGDDMLGGVLSLNLKRRHLSNVDRLEIAVKLVETERGANRYTSAGKMTIKRASVLLGVSEDSIQRARKIERDGVPNLREAVKKLGLSYKEGARIAALSVEEQNIIVNQGTWLRAVRQHEAREQKKAAREAFTAQPFPPEKYDIILADPPWFYAVDNGFFSSNPAFHYPTMTDEALAALPVKELAQPDAMLFMWATGLTLPRALALMTAWGFDYLTSGVWVKTRGNDPAKLSHIPGLGPMLMTHEYILIGKRGKGLGKTHFQPRSVFFGDGGGGASKTVRHSRKPEVIYDWLEKMWPSTRKIELFARGQREGWAVWGNEDINQDVEKMP